jgi:hypothetical protein
MEHIIFCFKMLHLHGGIKARVTIGCLGVKPRNILVIFTFLTIYLTVMKQLYTLV